MIVWVGMILRFENGLGLNSQRKETLFQLESLTITIYIYLLLIAQLYVIHTFLVPKH